MLKKIRNIQVAMLFALFVVVLASQFALVFIQNRSEKLVKLDKKLLVAAETLNVFLSAPSLHANLLNTPIDRQNDKVIAFRLAALAKQLDVAYLYSVMQSDNAIVFVTSSPTPEEIEGKEPYSHAFLTGYPEADESLINSFKHFSVEYAEYTDRWGSFRSVFVPRIADDGAVYVLGVDVRKHRLLDLTTESLLGALKQTVLFFVLCLPFVLIAIRASKRVWKEREKALFTDELTGLRNKLALLREIRTCELPNLLIINIDRFREIANVYGLAEGDAILRSYAYNLANYQYPNIKQHTAFRIHSDEFAVLADMNLPFEERLEIFKDFYKALVKQHYRMSDGKLITFSVKVGVSFGQVEDLYERAEMALRKARETNTSVVMFDHADDLRRQYQESIILSDTVKKAILEDRVVPFFQPIVNARTNAIEKYEALARIVDEYGDVQLLPDQFIPILKRDRFYSRFTLTMVKKSLSVAQKEKVDISINISTQDIADETSFDELVTLIAQSGVATRVHIELLECDSLVELPALVAAITRVKKIGCRVGLDDLGKGYSNFDRLTVLPIDFVKLDRSVMPNITNDIEVMRIAEDIVRFAKNKKITTVAEFCSDKFLCGAAKHMGIDFIQGFYLAEPKREIIHEVSMF